MSTMIKFNLTNQSNTQQDFFFFQKPAVYSGGSSVYANSIQSVVLAPYSTSSSTYTFLINMQFYAGIQQANSLPVIGKQSGFLSAIRPIDLTPATGAPSKGNATSLTLDPFGLSAPVINAQAEPGSFRIVSPVFNPNLNHVNGGSALMLGDGSVVLSNFTNVLPNQNLDCQPILKYYIQTGSFQSGTVMNFTNSSSSAALCDATEGETTFDVTYNADGTWTVASSC